MKKRYVVRIPCVVERLFKGEDEFRNEKRDSEIKMEVEADCAEDAAQEVAKMIVESYRTSDMLDL